MTLPLGKSCRPTDMCSITTAGRSHARVLGYYNVVDCISVDHEACVKARAGRLVVVPWDGRTGYQPRARARVSRAGRSALCGAVATHHTIVRRPDAQHGHLESHHFTAVAKPSRRLRHPPSLLPALAAPWRTGYYYYGGTGNRSLQGLNHGSGCMRQCCDRQDHIGGTGRHTRADTHASPLSRRRQTMEENVPIESRCVHARSRCCVLVQYSVVESQSSASITRSAGKESSRDARVHPTTLIYVPSVHVYSDWLPTRS